MRNRDKRVRVMTELIAHQAIGSQEELNRLLADRGYFVTQATLSRDLKMLKISKLPTERGTYMYVLPDNNLLNEAVQTPGDPSFSSRKRNGFISLNISGNIAVIKTRNGYAPGLAYDIDLSKAPQILGTIPGSNTIFAVLREDVTKEEALNLFSQLLHLEINEP